MYTVKRRIKFLLTMFLGLELLLLNHCITAFHRTNYSRLIGFIHEKNNRCININVKLWKNCPGFFGINNSFLSEENLVNAFVKKNLPGGESNPGLPRDRRGYLPLYYRGLVEIVVRCEQNIVFEHKTNQMQVNIDSEGQQNVGLARRVWTLSRVYLAILWHVNSVFTVSSEGPS